MRSGGKPSPSSHSPTSAYVREERRGVRVADLAHRVPVRAAGRQAQRPARRDPDEAPLRVEHVEERHEIVLVGPAPVEEDERALGLARRLAHEGRQVFCHASRGFRSGVSVGSICSRSSSNAGGSESRSPRDSSGSSAVKPGPSVAISNRTPLGSRK